MSNERSKSVLSETNFEKRSHLIKALETGLESLQSYEDIPNGIFNFKSIIKSGNITIDYDDLDFDFTVPFDDDLEANEINITIYNLSDNTINNLKKGAEISIEAGYGSDTGIIFKGYIDSVKTGYDGVDKVTEITCYNIAGTETVENITYAENTTASTILKDLISKLPMPLAVFNPKRDYTYTKSVTIDGNLREEIKKYAEVCGISVYAVNGSIYARHIQNGDNISFTVNEDTGMTNSPEYFTETITAEDYTDEVDGYSVSMLLQHRITTAAIINLSSKAATGVFRVRKGEHTLSSGEALTTFEAIST